MPVPLVQPDHKMDMPLQIPVKCGNTHPGKQMCELVCMVLYDWGRFFLLVPHTIQVGDKNTGLTKVRLWNK